MSTTATIACPHCVAEYPLSPVLLGRRVNCRRCRQPFEVERDGTTHAVAEVAFSGDDHEPPTTNRIQRDRPGTRRIERSALEGVAAQVGGESQPPARRATARILTAVRHSLLEDPRQEGNSAASPAATPGRRAASQSVDAVAAPEASAQRTAERRKARTQRFDRAVGGSDGPMRTERILKAMRQGLLGIEQAQDATGSGSSGIRVARQPIQVAGPTVSCPFCDEEYPFKPAMVDRNLRCRQCHEVFRVLAVGRAVPAINNREASGDHLPAPPPRSRSMAVRAGKARLADIAHGLGDLAREAAEAEEHKAPTTGRPPAPRTTTGRIHSAVLSGSGRRAGVEWWRVVLTLGILAAIAAVLVWVNLPGPAQRALQAFTAGADARPGRAAASAVRMRARAWSEHAIVQPILGISRAQLGRSGSASLAPWVAVAGTLRAFTPVPEAAAWVRTSEVAIAAGLLAEGLSDVAFRNAWQEERRALQTVAEIERRIRGLALPETAKSILAILLANTEPGPSGERLLVQDLPESLSWQFFSGEGYLLLNTGGSVPRRYRGLLVRFDNGPWRVFALQAAGKDGTWPVDLLTSRYTP